jgi:N-acetylglucosamine-6-sulfatase
VIEGQVTNLDTAPTILAAAGLTVPSELAGRDLLQPLADDRPVLLQNTSTYPDRFVGVRTSAYKFLRELNSGREELYDLSADPREEHDLLSDRPDLAAPLRAALEERLRECAGRARGQAVEVRPDAEAAKQLEELGYTGD